MDTREITPKQVAEFIASTRNYRDGEGIQGWEIGVDKRVISLTFPWWGDEGELSKVLTKFIPSTNPPFVQMVG